MVEKTAGTLFKFNVVGGGALAVLLYLLLYNFPVVPIESYVKGTIARTGSMRYVVGGARQQFLVCRPADNTDFQFVLFEKEADSPQVYFSFQLPENSDIREFYIGCIDTDIFREAMSAGRDVVFALEKSREGEYQLLDNRTARRVGKFNDRLCSGDGLERERADEVSFLGWLSTSAHAQSLQAPDLDSLLQSLSSEDASEREFARVKLASLKNHEVV